MKKLAAILVVALMAGIMLPVATACSKKLDSESSPLVLATTELDGVFNPFFATSGNDVTVTGFTQASLISSDKNAQPAFGADENTVALDFKETPTIPDTIIPNIYDNYYTTYEFLLKNDMYFSNGDKLTVADVLFNFYVYLDPAYTGSSTMYSVKIRGLKQYQAQSNDYGEYTQANTTLRNMARDRLARVMAFCESSSTTPTDEVAADIATLKKLIKEELFVLYSIYSGQVESMHEEYPEITKGWEVFFVNMGFITLNTENKTVKDWQANKDFDADFSNDEDLKNAAVEMVYNGLLPSNNLRETKATLIGFVYEGSNQYWSTALDYLTAIVGSELYKDKDPDELAVKSITGITVSQTTNFYGTQLNTPHDVIRIVIDGVDPKAKWNFAIPIVPMKAYTSPELFEAADVESHHYGVKFYNLDFMNTYVRGRQVPVGAGPYMASDSSGNANAGYRDFFKDNIVYMQRNPYFSEKLGKAKIKNLRFKVIASNNLYNAVVQGEVHYANPSVKKETIEDLNGSKRKKQLGSVQVPTLGYGYIGINAKFIPDQAVRKAIMHAMNTELTISYFSNGTASRIFRPMSKESWAYPKSITSPYYAFDSSGQTSYNLLWAAGYRPDARGILVKGDSRCEFVFTVASDNDDHPAWATFNEAKRVLEGIGCKVTIVSDKQTLSKLTIGGLQVWAAAWGSTIDPDMYQVYHKDSAATAVLNWGYPSLLSKGTSTEKGLITSLSQVIDQAREITDQNARTTLYHQALELVMELAVELPTYQRDDLFVYNKQVIDEGTLPGKNEISSFSGLLDRVWEINFKK